MKHVVRGGMNQARELAVFQNLSCGEKEGDADGRSIVPSEQKFVLNVY